MRIQNFMAQSEPQLHEKDIERHRISWSVQTHASQTHTHTHPQTTPRVSVETYRPRGETIGFKKHKLRNPTAFIVQGYSNNPNI